MSPLIDAPRLLESLDRVALFDLRWDLTDPEAGRKRYLEAHIPGALFVDVERDLTGTGPGRHPLPDPADFASTLGGFGLRPGDDVVVYDDTGGGVAARLWWMLEAIGHRGHVAVLDGGWNAWVDAGFRVESGEQAPIPAHYPAPSRGFTGVVDRELVRHERSHLLLDARSPDRYRGETEPVDPKAGHIPGAVNYPWEESLDVNGRFKAAPTLRDQLSALGADRRPVIVSCGSGVTACHVALAMEIAGLPRPRLYPGSFSDWSRTELPVVTGPDPR